MKYLKTFNESSNELSDIEETIKDICLELEDNGFIIAYQNKQYIKSSTPTQQGRIIIGKEKYNSNWIGNRGMVTNTTFKYIEVEEVVERIKRVLGDKYISSAFVPRRGNGIWRTYDKPGKMFGIDDEVLRIMIKYNKI